MTSLSLLQFEAMLREFFDHPDHCGDASHSPLELRQVNCTVADFSVEFRTLAADAGWNDAALWGAFRKGLNEEIKDELASRDDPPSLNSLISLSIQLDNCLRERRRERATWSTLDPRPRRPLTYAAPPILTTTPGPQPISSSLPEPMQLGQAHLSTPTPTEGPAPEPH